MAFLTKRPQSVSKGLTARPAPRPAPPLPKPRTIKAPRPSGVGRFVLSVRRDAGLLLDGIPWTQTQLARLLGRAQSTITHWESGRLLPQQGELDTLARLLEMARQGIDPRSITAPDIHQLVEERGPTDAERKSAAIPKQKPPRPARKQPRSIIDPRRRVIPGKRFATVVPRRPSPDPTP